MPASAASDPTSRPVVVCRQLTKRFRTYLKAPGLMGSLRSFVRREYRTNEAVSAFDSELRRGELVGLLGPNGAGKTTLIKMLTGIIAPSSGHAEVLGFPPFTRPRAFRKRIALVMGQKSQLWWDIPAMDSFRLLQRYYEIDDGAFRQRLGELSDVLSVGDILHVHVRKLSLGERMKMELMACLLHEPDVVFLDEPTIGLDIVAQRGIRDFLQGYQKRRGITIVLTSHYMADVQALCDRVVLILGGRKRFDGTRAGFEGILGREKFVTVRFAQPVARDHPALGKLDPVFTEDGMQVELRIAEEDLRTAAIEILTALPVVDLATEKLPIERVMATLMRRPEPPAFTMSAVSGRVRAEALKWIQTMQISWAQQMAYKIHFLLIVLGPTLVFFLVKYNLWTSIYAMPGVTRLQGYDLREMLRYQVWVMVLSFFAQAYSGMSLAEDIRLGRISSYLVYPFELWHFHTASFLAFQVVQALVAAATVLLTSALGVLAIPAPRDLAAGVGLGLLSGCFWYAVTFALGLGAFWLEETWVLRVIFTILCGFLSGAILPLDLYPGWLRAALHYSPFPYVTYVPVRVLMGGYDGSIALAATLLLFWTLLAAAGAWFVWRRGLALYTAAGM